MGNFKHRRIWKDKPGVFEECLSNSAYRIEANLHLLDSNDKRIAYNSNKSLLWAGFSQLEIEQINK